MIKKFNKFSYFRLETLINDYPDLKGRMVIRSSQIYREGEKPRCRFGVFESVVVVKKILKKAFKNRTSPCFNEVIIDKIVKPYVDLDFEYSSPSKENEIDVCNKMFYFMSKFKSVFKIHFGIMLGDEDIITLKSEGYRGDTNKYKYSFHIIIPKYKAFIEDIHKLISDIKNILFSFPGEGNFIDMSVYKIKKTDGTDAHNDFRLPYTITNKGDERIFEPYDNWTFEDCCLTYNSECELLELESNIDYGEKKLIECSMNMSEDKLLVILNDALNMIDKNVADNQYSWKSVGYCLAKLYHQGYETKDLFIQFSKKSQKGEKCDFNYWWDKVLVETVNMNKTKKSNLTNALNGIFHYIKEDHPDEYFTICKQMRDVIDDIYIDERIFQDEVGLSQIFIQKMKGELFINDSNLGYKLNKNTNIWNVIPITQDIILPMRDLLLEHINKNISTINKKIKDIVGEYLDLSADIPKKERKSDPKLKELLSKQKEEEEKIKKIKKVSGDINGVNKLEKILKASKHSKGLYMEDKKLDDLYYKNKYVFPFKNGVCMDFNLGKIRKIEKEDYIFEDYCSELNYREVKEDSEEVKFAKDFFDTIFWGDKELIEFVERICGWFMTKDVSNHAFFVFHGEDGRNGKDTLWNILTKILGFLAYKGSKGALLDRGKSQANSHTSHLNNFRKKNLIGFSEPEDNNFNVASIKEISGSEFLTIRKLGKEEESKNPLRVTFKMILLCNNIPDISREDKAFKARMNVINFPITFNIEKRGEENFREPDDSINDKIEKNIDGFVYLFIEGGKRFMKDRLQNKPKSVINFTNKYFKEQDTLADFLDSLETKEGIYTEVKELYESYEKSYPKRISKNLFGRELGKKYKKLSMTRERGVSYNCSFKSNSL